MCQLIESLHNIAYKANKLPYMYIRCYWSRDTQREREREGERELRLTVRSNSAQVSFK